MRFIRYVERDTADVKMGWIHADMVGEVEDMVSASVVLKDVQQ